MQHHEVKKVDKEVKTSPFVFFPQISTEKNDVFSFQELIEKEIHSFKIQKDSRSKSIQNKAGAKESLFTNQKRIAKEERKELMFDALKQMSMIAVLCFCAERGSGEDLKMIKEIVNSDPKR
jgi:hypothetical protein